MSSSIENRVVSMTFDNAAFERNAATTLGTLDKLKTSLDFGGTGKKSIEDLSGAAGRFDMGPMATQVEGVSAKFLALSTVAITALSNITAKVIQTGAQMVKSLTLDQVISGFQEYETNINSIQTIMANTQSKGSTLEDVNGALDELNQYSDKTIYNFSQMTKNVGTFTAAGVGLDKSVQSIKGIANLAAISGSNSEQASSAMYQLSQALAAGSLKAQDWISVVNSGMGGEIFQKALFESGKALKTINDVPIDQTFEQWKAAGNTFKGSLEDGWITADVLTSTLQGFTGELTEAQLLSMGYTKEQAVEIARLGKLGVDSATKVKTLTQLLGTVKEAIGSGWSSSFRLLIGNFEEAQELFTNMSQFIGHFVGKSADARNELLSGWRFFGGRDVLLQGLTAALYSVMQITKPLAEAFREVFPRTTVLELANMTKNFKEFFEGLKLSEGTIANLKSVFKGFFSILSIGWEVIKGVAGVFTGFLGSLGGVGGGFLSLAATAGDMVTKLREVLVTGGAISAFFNGIGAVINRVVPVIWGFVSAIGGAVGQGLSELGEHFGPAIEKIQEFAGIIKDFFGGAASAIGSGGTTAIEGAVDGIGEAFDRVGNFTDVIMDKFAQIGDFLAPVADGLKNLGGYISDFFKGIGEAIAGVFSGASFDDALKVVNTGLFGGLVVLIRKFIKDGLKLDFGQTGMFESITKSFDALTGTLKSFQTQIKAEALFKIAKAIAVLVAALLVLSLMDTDDLVRSLSAMAVGMGQLVGAMALLNTIGGSTGGGKLVALSSSLIILSGAVLVLGLAMKVMSSMSLAELGKGLLGVSATLLVFAGMAKILDGADVSFIKLAFGLGIISVSLVAFSLAIRAMASIDTGSLIKGMLGIAAAVALFVGATQLIDEDQAVKLGGGMFLFALSLGALSKVISTFGNMDLMTMIQGFLGLFAMIKLIIYAMKELPKGKELAESALGLLLVAGAVFILAKSVEVLGSLSLGELIKGLAGIAAVLLIVVAASNAMTGSAAGAVSMIVMAGALFILLQVLKGFASLGVGELLIGLVGIAAVIAILAGAAILLAPVIPLMIALGVALGVLGLAFALFGAGAYLVAAAFERLSTAGKKGIDNFIEVLKRLTTALPEILGGVGLAIIAMFKSILDAAPGLLESFKNLLLKLLDVVIEIIPKIGEVFGTLISTGINYIREKVPEFISLGYFILLSFLGGIRDNIAEIVTVVSDIIEEFIRAITDNLEDIIDAGVDLIVAWLDGIGKAHSEILAAGVNLLVTFLEGISSAITLILATVTDVITEFIDSVATMYTEIVKAGGDALIQFLSGVSGKIIEVAAVVTSIIVAFIEETGKNSQKIIDAGFQLLKDLLSGITDNVAEVVSTVTTLLIGLAFIILKESFRMIDAGIAVAKAFLSGMVDRTIDFVGYAGDLLIELMKGLRVAIEERDDEIAKEARGLARAIITALIKAFGLSDVLKGLKDAVEALASNILTWFKKKLEISSPSKVFVKAGKEIPAGIAYAINSDTSVIHAVENMGGRILSAFEATIKDIPNQIAGMEELNPTITPILDLSRIQSGAKGINALFPVAPVTAAASFSQAREIATTTEQGKGKEAPPPPPPTEVKFEQNIYSPTALSTSDIYRNTRSQIALAKEDLNIP